MLITLLNIILLVFIETTAIEDTSESSPSITKIPNGEVILDTLYSKELEQDKPIIVYLPPNYNENDKLGYPVLYLLHGTADGSLTPENDWIDKGNVFNVMDSLLFHNKVIPFIIVLPEGGEGWEKPYWSNTEKCGNYEDYFIDEVRFWVDESFNTSSNRESRAIDGLSMGGYGAILLGFKYPKWFGSIGSMSGAFVTREFPISIFEAINFDTLDSSLEDYIDNLQIYFTCGSSDVTFKANNRLDKLLTELDISHTYVIHSGEHNWDYWRKYINENLQVHSKYFEIYLQVKDSLR